jgi:hypothetical protein
MPPSESNNSSPNSSSFDRNQSFDRSRNFGKCGTNLYRHGSFGSAEDLSSSLDSSESGGGVQGPGFGGSFDSHTRHSDLFFSGNRAYSLAAASLSSRSPSIPPKPLPSIQGSPIFGHIKADRKSIQVLDDDGGDSTKLLQRQQLVSPRLSATQDEERSQKELSTEAFNGASTPSLGTQRSSGSMGSNGKSSAALRQRLMFSPRQSDGADTTNPFFSGGSSDGRTSPLGDVSVNLTGSSSAENVPEIDELPAENHVLDPSCTKAKISPAPILSRKTTSAPRPGLTSSYPWHS